MALPCGGFLQISYVVPPRMAEWQNGRAMDHRARTATDGGTRAECRTATAEGDGRSGTESRTATGSGARWAERQNGRTGRPENGAERQNTLSQHTDERAAGPNQWRRTETVPQVNGRRPGGTYQKRGDRDKICEHRARSGNNKEGGRPGHYETM